MQKMAFGLMALALSLTYAARVEAGIADTALPVLVPGQTTFHLYSVPGVTNRSNNLILTGFSCTSTSTLTQTVGVEVFPAAGGGPINNAATTAQSLAPGATVLFFTTGSASWGTQTVLSVPDIDQASARILSTSKSLICTAFVADANGSPTSQRQLTIVKGTKQKAFN